jgi:dTDP-glucose 4,6-dehydratase
MTANYSLPSQDLAFIHKKLSEQVGMPRGSILITGATGFFGRWVLEALTWIKESESLPLRISALVRSAGQFRSAMSDPVNESTHLIESDMATAISTDETYDYVLHMASPKISHDDPRSFHEHLVKGAQGMSQVIALARRSPHCRVLFTSSGAVYGDYWKGSGSC